MTSPELTSRTPPPSEEVVGSVLRRAHKVWIGHTSQFLEPISRPQASLWVRLTAVRYLADTFLGWYRRECALLEELQPFLPKGIVERLQRDAVRIGELQAELDRVGRKRSTGKKVEAASQELLRLLASWCAEIERASSRLPMRVLPEHVVQLITELERSAELHA